MPVFIQSPVQQAKIHRRQAMIEHAVEDISFSENYIICKCGTQLLAIRSKSDIASASWTQHLREAGQAPR